MNRCHCDTHANKPQLLTSPHKRGENKKSHLVAKSTFSLFILIKKSTFSCVKRAGGQCSALLLFTRRRRRRRLPTLIVAGSYQDEWRDTKSSSSFLPPHKPKLLVRATWAEAGKGKHKRNDHLVVVMMTVGVYDKVPKCVEY